MQREHLGSRLGFILLSAGCAIGIGNVWKFPWMAGQYGGGAFVLIYLLFLLIMGVPVLTMEFAMGRAAQKSPLKMYPELKPGSRWGWHGYVCLIGNVMLMMFYTTVSGWMLQYFVDTAAGVFTGLDTDGVNQKFLDMLANPGKMTLYMGIIVVLGFSIISLGVQKGLERVTKWMMLALILLMWILAFNSMFLEGGAEGLKFYLIPDLSRMQEIGIGNVIVGAMNQSFFTLSLGIGAMAIFGSYIGKDRSLLGEAVTITTLDTSIALMAGLIVFPACFTYNGGQTADAGSVGATFLLTTLSSIFNSMPGGRIIGALFFLFMIFAAYSTVIAVFENIVSFWIENTKLSRRTISFINIALMMVLALPAIFSLNIWGDVTIAGLGFLDLEDKLVSNLALPVGSLIYVLFCTTRYGWGWDKFYEEVNTGSGLKLPKWLKPYMTYVLPVIIFIVLLMPLFG